MSVYVFVSFVCFNLQVNKGALETDVDAVDPMAGGEPQPAPLFKSQAPPKPERGRQLEELRHQFKFHGFSLYILKISLGYNFSFIYDIMII